MEFTALYDFKARSEDELSINKGTIVNYRKETIVNYRKETIVNYRKETPFNSCNCYIFELYSYVDKTFIISK